MAEDYVDIKEQILEHLKTYMINNNLKIVDKTSVFSSDDCKKKYIAFI